MNRIRALRKEKGIPVAELTKYLGGISEKHYYDLETEKRRLHVDAIVALADVFNVSIDYLLDRTDSRGGEKKVPLLGTIRAGIPLLAEENWEGEVELPVDLQADFALRVVGDSMSWVGIFEGDLAILRQNSAPVTGMIVAAGVEEAEWSATLKFYVEENGRRLLRAANPEFEDIEITGRHRIIGHVVSIQKEPPALQDYRRMLIPREVREKQWHEAVEKAAALGLDGEKVKRMIELFSHMVKQV